MSVSKSRQRSIIINIGNPTPSVEDDKEDYDDGQFLLDCAMCTNDPFWYELIANMSIGKYPSGLKYRCGKLISETKSQAISIDPQIACDEIIVFIQTYLEINPPNHNNNENNEIKDVSGDSWTTMLKKNKEQAVVRFISGEQKKYNLTLKEQERLQHILNLGFMSKRFNKYNVNVNNYTITNIDGLLYNKINREYSIDQSLRRTDNRSSSRSSTKPKKTYNNTWDAIVFKIDSGLIEEEQSDEEQSDEEYSRTSY